MSRLRLVWVYVVVAVVAGLGGLAVAGLPASVDDDLVITERPLPPARAPITVVPTVATTAP